MSNLRCLGLMGATVMIGVLLLVFGPLGTEDAVARQPAEEVTVVMTEIAPFVIDDDGEPDGFYAEVWDEVAARMGVSYDVVWVDSFGDLLPAIADGRADVAIAPLAPTSEREAMFDFTSAVVSSGPQLAYSERLVSRPSLLRSIFDLRVLKLVGIALGALLLVAHIIWLVERGQHKDDGDFDEGYFRGVWDGLWWSTVTATTVGYGDKAPKSFRGRLIALIVMMASLVLVGAFVSQVTSIMAEAVNAAPIATLEDVNVGIGVVAESSFAGFIEESGAAAVPFESQSAVFEAARRGQVDVVVANPFALATLDSRFGLTPVEGVLYEEFETFGLAQDSEWREPINRSIADLHASGEIAEIIKDALN